jgi:hypothetical protein
MQAFDLDPDAKSGRAHTERGLPYWYGKQRQGEGKKKSQHLRFARRYEAAVFELTAVKY